VFEQLNIVGTRVFFLLKRTNLAGQHVNALLDFLLPTGIITL
jgi:hypothetical protein